jgi:hypothetical protein
MAEAAQARAAADAASLAAKQYQNALASVSPLKDTNFHTFRRELQIVANTAQWDTHILNPEVALPDDLTPKQEWDIRNAYAIICNKITGHPTEHKVSLIAVGDARAAWRQINKYFIKQSSLGKSTAVDKFWKASMQNTGLTVVPWGEAVHQRGEDLTQTGGTVTANDKALVYLNGLLPAFDPIRDALQTTEPPIPDGDTLYDVYKEKVEDWASAKGHLEASSGGSNSTKNRTFTVDGTRKIPANVDQNELCRMWSSFKCRLGDGCWRRHDGPG